MCICAALRACARARVCVCVCVCVCVPCAYALHSFIAQVVFFSILMLPAQFFIGTAGSQIARVTSDSALVNDYVRYFNLTYSLVSFITPAFGVIPDRLGFGVAFAFVNTTFILSFAVITWAPSVGWFILADVLYVATHCFPEVSLVLLLWACAITQRSRRDVHSLLTLLPACSLLFAFCSSLCPASCSGTRLPGAFSLAPFLPTLARSLPLLTLAN